MNSRGTRIQNQHTKHIYGHIHVARTGGLSLNGMLAQKYERICGNKGYSSQSSWDVVEKESGQRKADAMEMIGFEHCDYISHEVGWRFWQRLQVREIKAFADTPLELHVACRDPISHLMSLCNFFDVQFSCEGTTDEFISLVQKCLQRAVTQRFSMKLVRKSIVKCFDFRQQFTTYLHFMEQRLETKKWGADLIPPNFYAPDRKRKPRDNSTECIWKHPDLMDKAQNYMLTHIDYHRFCHQCLGSKDDLLTSATK